MASEDVLHCVYIPAFRLKQDVMPGRYTYLNFTPTKTGVYHLFCNQYCGTSHSNMIGKVVVMEPGDYQKWLGGFTGDPPEKVGEALFTSLACNTCHTGDTGSRGPLLNGVIGSKVALQGGNVVEADDTYIRESILNPQAKVVAGYQPIMPSFQGVVSQDQVNALIAYIKTLPAGSDTQAAVSTAAVGASQGAVAPPADAAKTGTAEAATLPSTTGTPAVPRAPENTDSTPAPSQSPAPAEAPAPQNNTGEAAPTGAAANQNTESTNAATTAGEAPGQAPVASDAQTTTGEQQGVQ
jgi:cytochrome c oxidase subunit 2